LLEQHPEAAADVALMSAFLAGVGKPGIVRRRARGDAAESEGAGA